MLAKEAASERLAEAAERARPKVEAAQDSFNDTVLPKLAAAVTAAAAAIAAGAEQAREAAAPRVEHARETAVLATDRSKDAYSVLKGDAVAKPRRGGAGKWLIGLGLAAAAVAAVAAFRKQQQADDPWATPLSDGAGNPPASLKDKAAGQVEHAKEVVTDAAGKAKDAAGDLAAKGQSALADAKDRSGELADEAEHGVADMAERAEKAAGTDDETGTGQVTAVDASLGSDAITSDAVEDSTAEAGEANRRAGSGDGDAHA